MIKPILNVKILSNPKQFYQVKHISTIGDSLGYDNTISKSAKKLKLESAAQTKDLKSNIAIILQSLKQKFIINTAIEQENLETMSDNLRNIIKEMRENLISKKDEIVAFVTGGREYNSLNPYADKGRDVSDKIIEFLEEEKIPATVLLEQKGKLDKGLNVYAHRDNAVLYGGIMNDINKGKFPKDSNELKEFMEEFFDYVQISPKAPIQFSDGILPPHNTPKSYFK